MDGFLATRISDASLLVASLAILIPTVTAAVASLITLRRAGKIHQEVKTFNELTIGQLGEAIETRRISQIDPTNRTAREWRHVSGSPGDPEPPVPPVTSSPTAPPPTPVNPNPLAGPDP